MFYIYTLLIPSILILLVTLSFYKKLSIINLLLTSCVIISLYTSLMYYLEITDVIEIGWISYSLFFFLFPISLVVGIIKLFKFIKLKI